MKTVKEWLETIADENVRNRAIANSDEADTLNERCDSLFWALHSFTWEYTPEGWDFWNDIEIQVNDNTLKTTS